MDRRFLRIWLTTILLLAVCSVFLPCTASADVIHDQTLSAFPLQQKDGSWAEHAPRPFIDGEMGDGLLEIWFGRISTHDCIIVRCNGEVMLIDGGTKGHSNHTLAFLDQLGVKRIDHMFNTHYHDDHLEAQVILARIGFPIGRFLTPYDRGEREEAQVIAERTMDQAGIPYCTVRNGDTMMLGGENGAQITFYRWMGNKDPNMTSMMCKIVYRQRSFFSLADVTNPAQNDLAKNYLDVIPWDSDIFKVGHHGYLHQNDQLLSAISPELCIIPNGWSASEPCRTQLDRLNLDWYVTSTGTVYLRTDGGESWQCVQDKTYLQQP